MQSPHKILRSCQGIGDLPVIDGQYLNTKVTAGSRLKTVEDFKNIVVKSNKTASYVYLKDIARVELGAENYQSFNTINGYPLSRFGYFFIFGCKCNSDL